MNKLIRIDGEKIKKIRKKLGFTQSSLAKGICVQGTISNIEKKGIVDSLEIISNICTRLKINLQDVLIEDDELATTKVLNKLKKLTSIGEFNEASNLLKYFLENEQLNLSELQSEKIAYLDYYQGLFKLLVEKDNLDSLFYFQKVLDSSLEDTDIIKISTINELGVAYDLMNKSEQAQYYMDKSVDMFELTDQESIEGSKIYYNAAKFFSKINQYHSAVVYCKRGIEVCYRLQSTNVLGFLYYELAYNLYEIGDKKAAYNTYNESLVIAKINRNEYLQEVILKDMKERDFKAFYLS